MSANTVSATVMRSKSWQAHCHHFSSLFGCVVALDDVIFATWIAEGSKKELFKAVSLHPHLHFSPIIWAAAN